jgi:hypothetical protein
MGGKEAVRASRTSATLCTAAVEKVSSMAPSSHRFVSSVGPLRDTANKTLSTGTVHHDDATLTLAPKSL